MKKFFSVLFVITFTASIFAVSYKNNTYQKLADEYTKKAEKAMDAGEYEDSIEYARLAEENAELSRQLQKMQSNLQKISLHGQKKLMLQIFIQWHILLQKII